MNKENNEHIDLGGLSMDKLFDGMNIEQLKLKSPTAKINFCLENKLVVAGVQLMCIKENPVYDTADLNDNTIISIDKHHLIECILMIYGALYTVFIANDIKYTDNINRIHNDVIEHILNFYRDGILKYKECIEFNQFMYKYIFDYLYKYDVKEEYILKFKDILDCIWFLPYSEIDKLKESFADEINGVVNNESDD